MPSLEPTTSSSSQAARSSLSSWDPSERGELDAFVAEALSEIARDVRATLAPRALLLVGSYARAEGGAVLRGGALRPYNDLDLVVVVRRIEPGTAPALEQIARRWTERLQIAVDLWPIEESRLSPPPRTWFWLDVSLGGVRVVDGDRRVLQAVQVRPRDVPLEEAARLLANRALGLALSRLDEEGARSETAAAVRDDDRVRHLHKAALACGDAWMLSAGVYVGGSARRSEVLARLEPAPAVGPDLVAAYRDACRFRARPDRWRPARGDVAAWAEEVRPVIARAHLAFEAMRVGSPEDPLGYSTFAGRLFPELPDVRPLGPFVSALRARRDGLPLFSSVGPWVGHPRERLARVAMAIAHGDESARRVAGELLGTRGADAAAWRSALVTLSHRGG